MGHLEPLNGSTNNQPAVSKSVEPSVTNNTEQELTSQENIIAVDNIMCSPPKKRSKSFDEQAIIMGNELTDVKINFAQQLLKAQFKNIRGLEPIYFNRKVVHCQRIPYKTGYRFSFVKNANIG